MATGFLPLSDPIDILLAHTCWANQEIIAACTPLTDAHFHRQLDMGLRSLHDTLVHIIGAMHHRAQCLNMFRHIYAAAGAETPLPQSSVMDSTRLDTQP